MNINETFLPFTSGANISGTLRLECQKKNFSVRHDVFYGRLNEGDIVWAPDSRLTMHISVKRGLLNFWPINLHGCERCIKSNQYDISTGSHVKGYA